MMSVFAIILLIVGIFTTTMAMLTNVKSGGFLGAFILKILPFLFGLYENSIS